MPKRKKQNVREKDRTTGRLVIRAPFELIARFVGLGMGDSHRKTLERLVSHYEKELPDE